MSLQIQMRRPYVIVNDEAGTIARGLELLTEWRDEAGERAESVGIFDTRADFTAWVALGNTVVAGRTYWVGGVKFEGSPGATAIPDLPGLVPSGVLSTDHWMQSGGVPADNIDHAPLIQIAQQYAIDRGQTLQYDGLLFVRSTISVAGAPKMRAGSSQRLYHAGGDFPIFTVTGGVNTSRVSVVGMSAECEDVSVDADNAFMKFVGPNTALILNSEFRDNIFTRLRSGWIYAMDARTSAFGLEGGVNWSTWDNNFYVNVLTPHLFKTGTGTGNNWANEKPRVRPGGIYFHVDPIGSNYVAGDVIIAGAHGNGIGGAATFIKIENGTVYGAQWLVTDNQFDANMTMPIALPSDFTFLNWTVENNNWGGSSTLGADIQPIRASTVTDRDFSEWRAGNVKSSSVSGLVTNDFFEVTIKTGTLGGATFGAVLLEIDAFTETAIPGAGPRLTRAVFWLATDGTTLTATQISQDQYINSTGALLVSIVAVSGTVATVRVSHDSNNISPRNIRANIRGSGGSPFKIRRLP